MIASETRTEIRMTRAGHHEPATASAEVQRSIESAAGSFVWKPVISLAERPTTRK